MSARSFLLYLKNMFQCRNLIAKVFLKLDSSVLKNVMTNQECQQNFKLFSLVAFRATLGYHIS